MRFTFFLEETLANFIRLFMRLQMGFRVRSFFPASLLACLCVVHIGFHIGSTFQICSVLSIQNAASLLFVMEVKTRTSEGTLGAAGCYIWKTMTFVIFFTTPRILVYFHSLGSQRWYIH